MAIEYCMKHLNFNALCSVWIETSGNDPRIHSIVQVCVMLLDNFIRPSQAILPFYFDINPGGVENVDYKSATLGKERLLKACISGIPAIQAADYFDDWFKRLDLPRNKKIVALTHNWPLKRQYFEQWLGFHNFRGCFSEEYRDLQPIASYCNDRLNLKAEPAAFPKVTDQYIGNMVHIESGSSLDIIEKCANLSSVYRNMMGIKV